MTSLVVITAWTGFYMGAAKSGVSSLTWTLLNALVGIGVTCAGSAALNEVLEHKIDALMRRTRNRPLPAGRMSLATGLTAGILATVLGRFIFAHDEHPYRRAGVCDGRNVSGVLYATEAHFADLNFCRRISRRHATAARLDCCARQTGN